MTHLLIESDANPRVKRWKRLAADARFLRREGALLIEGIHLAEVVLEHPDVKVSAVILSAGRSTNEAAGLADKLASAKGAKVYVLSDRLYDGISPVENGVGCAWSSRARAPHASGPRRCSGPAWARIFR